MKVVTRGCHSFGNTGQPDAGSGKLNRVAAVQGTR